MHFCLSSRMKERLRLPLSLLSAEHLWMSQPLPLHVDMSSCMSSGSSFRPQRPPLHFGFLVTTPLTLRSNGMIPPGAHWPFATFGLGYLARHSECNVNTS